MPDSKQSSFISNSSRHLSIPRQVLNLLSLSEDSSKLYTSVSQVILLETCCLFICNSEMYKVDLLMEGNDAAGDKHSSPQLVQSYVLDGCAIEMNTSDKALILTAEYSILLFERNEVDRTHDFSEIHESFLSDVEIEHLPSDARTSMFADFDRGIVIAMTHSRILIITLGDAGEEEEKEGSLPGDEEEDETAIATSSHKASTIDKGTAKSNTFNNTIPTAIVANKVRVRGVSFIDVALQRPLVCEATVKAGVESALQFASKSFEPIIEHMAVWGADGITCIPCAGNGTWIELYDMERDPQSGAWKPSAPKQSFYDHKKEGFFPHLVQQHLTWISALSRGSRSTICASGDSSGGLIIWTPNLRSQKFEKAMQDTHFCHPHRITCLHNDVSNNALWICDLSGVATLAFYDVTRNRLERIRTTRLLSFGCGATNLQWRQKTSTGADTRGRLRVLCGFAGVAVECFLHDSAAVIFSAAVEPAHIPGHRSVVEVCAVMPELDLVITAGCRDKAYVWDLTAGQLLATIPSRDMFFTSIATFDSGFVADGDARILTGHSNGHTHDYVLCCNRSQQAGENKTHSRSILTSNDGNSGKSKVSVSKPQALDQGSSSILISQEEYGAQEFAQTALNMLSVSQEGSDLIVDQGAARVSESIVKVTYQWSTDYTPLPVTQILTSALGLYYAFCYAQSCIVIHSWEDRRALTQVQFDNTLVEISCLSSAEYEDLEADSFIIVLQGQNNVKVWEALSGQILTTYQTGQSNIRMASSALWDLPMTSDGPSSRRIVGVCASNGPAAYVFGDMAGCTPVQLQDSIRAAAQPKVDGLVLGCRAFHPGQSPFASMWTFRSLFWLRLNLDTATPQVLRIQEYTVPSEKVRVVLGQSLKMVDRTHRVAVVMSDGTVCLLTL